MFNKNNNKIFKILTAGRHVLLILIFVFTFSINHAYAVSGYKVNKSYDLVPTDKSLPSKVVLLTFDDGPTKRSQSIMDILAKYNIKTIFFINGIHDKEVKGVIASEFKAGHSIGNHTWSHQNLSKIKYDKAVQEIDSNSKLIKAITGADPTFFRSPFGVSTKQTRDYVAKAGMLAMNWSDSVKDWEKNTKKKEVFIKNVMKDLHPGAIILMHEHPHTVAFLPDLIEAIKSAGYTFITPSQIVQ
jgi:peptidoglycan/xylan/chitin deacetylase (PgdA/CDA1 family)